MPFLLDFDCELALARAKELDTYFDTHGRLFGPLHGLPASFKDQLHVEGLETTMGYVGWIGTFEGHKGTGKERHFESQLVTSLRSLGAIPFAKVNHMKPNKGAMMNANATVDNFGANSAGQCMLPWGEHPV